MRHVWLRDVMKESFLLLVKLLLPHVLNEHFTSLQQSNAGVMSSLTDQSCWEFPLSKSSSCYLQEAEVSCLPGISQDKTHSSWQVFVSTQQTGMQKTTLGGWVVSAKPEQHGEMETSQSWTAGTSADERKAGESYSNVRKQVYINNSWAVSAHPSC